VRAPARPRGRAHGGGGDLWQEVAQDGGHLLDVGRVLRGLRAGRRALRDERVDRGLDRGEHAGGDDVGQLGVARAGRAAG
jgi:hypothetical protein